MLQLTTRAQFQPFKEYCFETGGFVLILKSDYIPLINTDSLFNCYIENIYVLNEIKEEWKFDSVTPVRPMGPFHSLILAKDKKIVTQYKISFSSETIETDSSKYDFNPHLLYKYRDFAKRFYLKEQTFTSIQEGRKETKNLNDKMGVILIQESDWMRFEGEFCFIYNCSSWSNDCMKNRQKYLDYLENKIRKYYPGEDFVLDYDHGSGTKLNVVIKCNKSLFDAFNTYQIKNQKWEPYTVILKTYWKSLIEN